MGPGQMHRIMIGAAVMAAGLLGAASPALAVTELVTNGGFETGFGGWTAGFTPGHRVCCDNFTDTGTRAQGGDNAFFSPLIGVRSAFGDWDGGLDGDYGAATDFWVRQGLTKTSDVSSAILTFSFNVGGGAYKSYEGGYQGYTEVVKRNVTANFLGADLSLQSNLYTFERPLLLGTEPLLFGQQNITLDVTAAFNALGNGAFVLDFGRHVPQYFTGPGYFALDGISLSVGDAIAEPTGGIPEPSSWALMILGFGGAGAVVRRRRAAVV